jgi:hypothetical protein
LNIVHEDTSAAVIIDSVASVVFQSCSFSTSLGDSIHANNTQLIIRDSKFESNGPIEIRNARLDSLIERVEFTQNPTDADSSEETYRAALAVYVSPNLLTIQDCVFADIEATSQIGSRGFPRPASSNQRSNLFFVVFFLFDRLRPDSLIWFIIGNPSLALLALEVFAGAGDDRQ